MRAMLILTVFLAAPAIAGSVDAQADALLCALDPACVVSLEDANRRADEAQASIAMAMDRSQQPVRDRLASACASLYATRPDETITNPLCYNVFLESGLPE